MADAGQTSSEKEKENLDLGDKNGFLSYSQYKLCYKHKTSICRQACVMILRKRTRKQLDVEDAERVTIEGGWEGKGRRKQKRKK